MTLVRRAVCLVAGHRLYETGLLMMWGHAIPVLVCLRCGAES